MHDLDELHTEEPLILDNGHITHRWNRAWKKLWPKNIGKDIAVGLSITIVVIPQSMAYAMLAGLPPEYGLYTSLIPPLIYSMIGKCRQISFGTFALVSLMVNDGLRSVGYNCNGRGEGKCPLTSSYPTNDALQYINAVLALSLLTGIIQVLMAGFQLGMLTSMIADPVLSGFTTGAAILIIASQVKAISGIRIHSTEWLFKEIYQLLKHLDEFSIPNVILATSGVLLLVGISKLNQRFRLMIPGPLVLVVISSFVVWACKLNEDPYAVNVIGTLDVEIQRPKLPQFGIDWKPKSKYAAPYPLWVILLRPALTISILSCIISVSIVKIFAPKYNEAIHSNTELLAYGAANTIGSLFNAIPSCASLSRGSLIDFMGEGDVSMFHNIVTTIVVLVFAIACKDAFYYLPKAVLASIIMVAVGRLVHLDDAKFFCQASKWDFVMWIVAFLSTIFTTVVDGILFGIGFSTILLLHRTSRPDAALLSQVGSKSNAVYVDAGVHATWEHHRSVLVYSFASSIHFANVEYFERKLRDYEHYVVHLKAIIFCCASIRDIDATSQRVLRRLVLEYRGYGVRVAFAACHRSVEAILQDIVGTDLKEQKYIFSTIQGAVDYVTTGVPSFRDRSQTL